MSTYLLSGSFWIQTVERSVKTFAQAAIALLTGEGLGLLTLDVVNVASVAGLAAVISVLTSVASGPVGPTGSPSLVQERAQAGDPQAAAALIPTPVATMPGAARPGAAKTGSVEHAEPAGTGA
ncbi:MAG TPA: holin [Micromonosporaceae bacterium]|nr:holin [Micromonosporaceae bacterium]